MGSSRRYIKAKNGIVKKSKARKKAGKTIHICIHSFIAQ